MYSTVLYEVGTEYGTKDCGAVDECDDSTSDERDITKTSKNNQQ